MPSVFLRNFFRKIKRYLIMPLPILPNGSIDKTRVSNVSKILLGSKPVIFMLVDGHPEYFGDNPELTRLIRNSGIVLDEITIENVQIVTADDLKYSPEKAHGNFFNSAKKA